MAEGRWFWRLVFVAVVTLIVFIRILPLPFEAGGIPGPDWVMALCCAWVLRRPEHVPALLIAVVALIEDMITLRPPGLGAVVILLGCEFLRARSPQARDMTLLSEGVLVGLTILVMMLATRLVMWVSLLPQPGLGITLLHVVMTVLAYPVVVVMLRLGWRLGPAGARDVDAYGRRS